MPNIYERVATLIADYRHGEVPTPNEDHVRRWADQFGASVRVPLLTEMEFILEKSYQNKSRMKKFIEKAVNLPKKTGQDPGKYWKQINFLRIQQAGDSQRYVLDLFDRMLIREYDLSISVCGGNFQNFVYLDDAVYSGGRVKSDIIRWLQSAAPANSTLYIITFARHRSGEYIAERDINKAAKDIGKRVDIQWISRIVLEDRKYYMNESDVLRPKTIPQEAEKYIQSLGWDPVLRKGASTGGKNFFSSGTGRNLIEQEFLKEGIRVRELCQNLPEQHRPLGSTWLSTTGFGTMFTTHRNCANNAPLVLWVGDPWYPLLPRRINV